MLEVKIYNKRKYIGKKDLRINHKILVREVRLIDAKGVDNDVMNTIDALQIAKDTGLDLVEMSPNANPPVCRYLIYGKYKFILEKKNKESKKKQRNIRLKEIRMQPRIDEHDLSFKAKHIKQFLEEGNKVKVTIRFRGRELAHTELGEVKLNKVLTMLDDSYIIDKKPKMEGKFMSMFLSPKTKK